MGFFTTLLTFPVSGPLHGVRWIAQHMAEQAEQEFYDPAVIKEQLRALEYSYELGEVDDDTFDALEDALMERLEASRAQPKRTP
ncbi:MAG: gas vesicle protein GvpG [Bacteroidota bacterium]